MSEIKVSAYVAGINTDPTDGSFWVDLVVPDDRAEVTTFRADYYVPSPPMTTVPPFVLTSTERLSGDGWLRTAVIRVHGYSTPASVLNLIVYLTLSDTDTEVLSVPGPDVTHS